MKAAALIRKLDQVIKSLKLALLPEIVLVSAPKGEAASDPAEALAFYHSGEGALPKVPGALVLGLLQ
jgi:hypothetical protein